MWRWTTLVAATMTSGLCSATSAQAQRHPIVSISQPAGETWGPVVLAIVEQQRALPTGGYYCPDDEAPDVVCISASIVEGPVRIARILSALPPEWQAMDRQPRIRFLSAHGVRNVRPARHLALLEQTGNGYYWRVWSAPIRQGWACIPDDVMMRFGVEAAPSSRLRFRTRSGEANCLNLLRYR